MNLSGSVYDLMEGSLDRGKRKEISWPAKRLAASEGSLL
jgi:hypothetical protein